MKQIVGGLYLEAFRCEGGGSWLLPLWRRPSRWCIWRRAGQHAAAAVRQRWRGSWRRQQASAHERGKQVGHAGLLRLLRRLLRWQQQWICRRRSSILLWHLLVVGGLLHLLLLL